MSKFQQYTIETAGDSAKFLTGAKEAYGFVPNLLATMAESPQLLEGYIALSGLVNDSSLSATEAQVVLMSNNRLNGCTYCMAAHTTISQMAKVPEDVIEALRKGTAIADPKLETLRLFAIKVNESRGFPEQADLDALYAAGYTQQTVLEVILATALKVMSNYTNHVAQTPVDVQFAPNAWSPEDVVAQ